MSELNRLKNYMRAIRNGLLPNEIKEVVLKMLAAGWSELTIDGDAERMLGSKLINRTPERVTWNAPVLSFDLERHGPTAMGSIYAEVHTWCVNLEAGDAHIVDRRKRQVGTKAPAMHVKPLANEIAKLVLSGAPDPRLKWKSDDIVRLNMAEIIPLTNAQTTSSRRKKFRTALLEQLAPHGWKLEPRGLLRRHVKGDSHSPASTTWKE